MMSTFWVAIKRVCLFRIVRIALSQIIIKGLGIERVG